MDVPGDADVRYELKSVFLIRNSHCVGTAEVPAASSASSLSSPVGGDAIAKKIGLASSSVLLFLVWKLQR